MRDMLDGVNCINVYSKGSTALGRWMSNFTREPIFTCDGRFESIEGYWYWLGTQDEHLRDLWGFEAKRYGRSVPSRFMLREDDFRRRIRAAIIAKCRCNSAMVRLLKSSTMPFAHFYVYGGQQIPAGNRWVIEIWEEIRSRLKTEGRVGP